MLGLKYPYCLCTDWTNFVCLNCTIVIRLEFFNIDVSLKYWKSTSPCNMTKQSAFEITILLWVNTFVSTYIFNLMNIWDELKAPKDIFEGHLNESYDKRTTKKLPSIFQINRYRFNAASKAQKLKKLSLHLSTGYTKPCFQPISPTLTNFEPASTNSNPLPPSTACL